MRKTKTALTFLVIGLILLGSCAHLFTKGGSDYRAGDRAFNAEKYDEAVIHALQALDVNPEFEDAKALLDKAFKTGTSAYESIITQKKATSEPFRWDDIWKAYASLDKMHRAVAASPYSGEYSTKPYAAPLGEAREKAAAERYAAGVETLGKGGFRNARKALNHFAKADEAVPGYQDLNAQVAKARKQAVSKVVIAANGGRFQELRSAVKQNLEKQESMAAFDTARATLTLSRAKSSYSASHDFLIYLDVSTQSEKTGPESNEGPLVSGGKATLNTTVGYQKTYTVSAQLIDLGSGRQVASKTYRNSTSDSIDFSWMGWERKEELNLASYGGKLHYNLIDMTAAQYQAMDPLIRKAMGLVLNKTPQDIKGETTFAGLKRNFNGAFVIRGAEAIAHPRPDGQTGYQPIYTSNWSEHSGLSRNASRLYSTLKSHSQTLAEAAPRDFSQEHTGAAEDVAAAFKGKM